MNRLRCVCLLLAALASAPSPASTQPIAPGVEWIAGRLGIGVQADGNSVLIDAPQGWIVVDTGRRPAHVQSVLERVRASGKPVRVIVNTHWHLDHIGGNRALRDAFPEARLVASDAIVDARSGFLAAYRRELVDELARRPGNDPSRGALQHDLDVIDDAAAATPEQRITEPATLDLAGRRLRIGLERHMVTAGDVWLFDPGSGVLVAGDLVTLPAPLFDTACPDRWTLALEQFAAIPFRWLIPGHGSPLDRAQFVVYRESYYRLLRCATSGAAESTCIEGWLRDAGALVPKEQEPLARSLLAGQLERNLRPHAGMACRR
jgi:glyoxylase-like metal-dependent hydrolase (beta-lactamase superfamily II)